MRLVNFRKIDMKSLTFLLISNFFFGIIFADARPIKVLILDGQNNHNWKATTPVLVEALQYENLCKGRVFHTPMGHADYSMKCVGFQDVLRRGTQWAAMGQVKLKYAKNFPGKDKTSVLP